MKNKVLIPISAQGLRKKLMKTGMYLIISGTLTVILGLVLTRLKQEYFGFSITLIGILTNGLGALLAGLMIRDDNFYYKDKNQAEVKNHDQIHG